MPKLRGITWRHTRGLVPLLATAQVYEDLHPGTTIEWATRSLWSFGQGALGELFETYDMVVVDHPFVGFGAETGLLLPLDDVLERRRLRALGKQSAGPSHASYEHGGRQWALAIDAAGHAAVSRPDLLQAAGLAVPQGWDEVVALARETGRVAIPLAPIDLLSCWFTLCAQLGASPCPRDRGQVVDREIGREALARLGDLAGAVDPEVFELNPIRMLTRMATSDAWWYCPLTYSYSNYSRDGYAPHRLTFHDIPAQPGGRRRGATLGGAGLALSARSPAAEQAAAYVAWVAEADCQRTVYVQSGGQPGNRLAWEDDTANTITHGFFRATLPTLDAAYLRPNFNGFADFQDEAAQWLHDTLVRGGDHGAALDAIDARYALALRQRGGR